MHPLIALEDAPDHRITVADDLPLTDPRLLAAQRPLLRAKRDSAGLIAAPQRLADLPAVQR